MKYNRKQKRLSVDEKVNVFENPKKILYQRIQTTSEDFHFGIYNDSFNIEDEDVIEELGRNEIPEKYKSFRNPKIIFAFSLNQESLLKKTSNKDLFCYLPLKDTNYGFPFYINSDFIPDLDRTKPISNLKYNQSIMFKAGVFFVDLLEAFTKHNNGWKYAPMLIPENHDSEEILVQDFWRGMDSVIIERSIFNSNLEHQCRLNEILIDKEGFAARVLCNDFDKFYPEHRILNSAYTQTKTIESLIKRYEAGIVLNKSKIKSFLEDESFRSWLKIPENNFSLLKFLHESDDDVFKIILDKQDMILTKSNELLNRSKVYEQCVPDEISFITNNIIHPVVSQLLVANNIDIELKPFDPSLFFREHIQGNWDSVNKTLHTEERILNFWGFIYDYWDIIKSINGLRNSLKQLNILCKSGLEEGILIQQISITYLSKEYNPNDEIESVVEKLNQEHAKFVSPKFIFLNRSNIETWKKIFEEASSITDLQKVINDLLPKIKEIDTTKHFEIAKQIFRSWKKNDGFTQYEKRIIRENIKILTVRNQFNSTSNSIISDHFNNNDLISGLIPEISIDNLISPEYDPQQKDIANWKRFFRDVLGCEELTDRQDVLNLKLQILTEDQTNPNFRNLHLQILGSLSSLFKERSANNLRFDRKLLSDLQLKTSKNEWVIADNLYFTSAYKPEIELESIDNQAGSYSFISTEYKPESIDKHFLKHIGVKSGFTLSKVDSVNIDEFKSDKSYFDVFFAPEAFQVKYNYLLTRYTKEQIHAVTYIKDHLTISCIELSENKNYNQKFWQFLQKEENLKHLTQKTSIWNYNSIYYEGDNHIIWYLKNHNATPNQNNELKRTSELYSANLSKYIDDKSLLPLYDLSAKIKKDNRELTIEEVIGINQQLTPELFLNVLSKERISLDLNELKALNFIDVFLNYIPQNEETINVSLMNQKGEWVKASQLCVCSDEELQIDLSKLLHPDLIPLKDVFGIPEIALDAMIFKVTPEPNQPTTHVINFFSNMGKYIAFKIGQEDYSQIEQKMLQSISNIEFFEVEKISKITDISGYEDIMLDFQFYNDTENKKVFYNGFWTQNKELLDFLFSLINEGILPKRWFDNVIQRWSEKDVVNKLVDEFGELTEDINPSDDKKQRQESNSHFFNEVLDYIETMREVEDIYDESKIEDLKSIAQNFKDHPEERRKSLNLLAKLKLCKKKGIEYDESWSFNQVLNRSEKYFIHSARGAFAYIHPNELIRMRDDGFKMAIDFGTKEIRVFDSHFEIMQMHQNYLMLYQGSPDVERIMELCEENSSAEKFHFLLVDKEKQTDEALLIMNLIGRESYD